MKKSTKKTKATFYDIPSFHSHGSAKMKDKKGFYYKLCVKLTKEDKEELINKYSNIELFTIQQEYAPEIKTDVIFIYN